MMSVCMSTWHFKRLYVCNLVSLDCKFLIFINSILLISLLHFLHASEIVDVVVLSLTVACLLQVYCVRI